MDARVAVAPLAAVKEQSVGFLIFTVFMVCLIATSVVMGLVGVVFDAMRASKAVPLRATSGSELSLISGEVLESQVPACR
jgi:predicted DNA repair protein MutK